MFVSGSSATRSPFVPFALVSLESSRIRRALVLPGCSTLGRSVFRRSSTWKVWDCGCVLQCSTDPLTTVTILRFVDLAGTPGSGKTEVMLAILASCILPAHCGQMALGGLGLNGVLLDCDASFSALRMHAIIRGRIDQAVRASQMQSTNCSTEAASVFVSLEV